MRAMFERRRHARTVVAEAEGRLKKLSVVTVSDHGS